MTSTERSQHCLRQGQAAIQSGAYKEAHSIAIAALNANKEDPAPYFLLASIAEDHGNTEKAEELFKAATILDTHSIFYASHYARILSVRSKHSEARALIEAIPPSRIMEAETADRIGVILSRSAQHDKATAYFKHAIALNPNPDNFHYNLGASLQFSGHFEAAEIAYRKAILQNPNHARAYSSLIALSKQTEDKNELKALYALFDGHKDEADIAMHIGHAIAKTLEDIGQYEDSLSWLHKAKAKKIRTLNYDFEGYLKVFEAAKDSYENLPTPANTSDAAPIFIIGLPRTGTTLVDRILSSHPDVISCGELSNFANLIKRHSGTASSVVLDSQTLLATSDMDIASIGHDYWEETEIRRKGFDRMTDKMPLNFFYAGAIHKAFPKARIICLRRNAMDSCLSNYRQLFSTSYSYYNYTLSLDHIAKYYLHFDGLMSYWESLLPSDRFMQIHYENIVFDQDAETRKLLAFCGLSWDDACLRFHENKAAVSTASSVQVRRPLYSGSVNRWKKYGASLNDLKTALKELPDGQLSDETLIS